MEGNMVKKSSDYKIALLSSSDSQNKRSWSGIPYQMGLSLEKHMGEVHHLGPVISKVEGAGRYLDRFTSSIFGKKYGYHHSVLLSKRYAQIFKKKLQNEDFDFILAPAASCEIAFLKTDIPIVYCTDATFQLAENYYHGYFTDMLDISSKEGNLLEQKAIDTATILTYPSGWAAESAINDYNAPEDKVYVIPFGANIEGIPPLHVVQDKRKSVNCNLLFLGVDWERKGGPIAFETLLELEKLGINANLTVCGVVPPEEFNHPRMRVIPFLDKNDPQQRLKLNQLIMSSDFLIFPSRSECLGIVVAEANAFGVPAITTNTGGIPWVVEDGFNGVLHSLEDRGREYAETIARIFNNDEIYYEMVKSSRQVYEEKMNWDNWGKELKKIVDKSL
jgi:glycosyltransferase involved in cell wall biosynthesis